MSLPVFSLDDGISLMGKQNDINYVTMNVLRILNFCVRDGIMSLKCRFRASEFMNGTRNDSNLTIYVDLMVVRDRW